jgi:hypothetical protein
MAWTAPRTWVAGETVSAALMNTHVRDNLLMVDPGTWAAATLLNSWVDFGAPHQPARYRKISGIVFVQGFVKNGTGTAATNILTLPVGFRPAATITFPQTVGPGPSWSGARVDVDSSGNVQVGQTLASSAYLSLTLSFPADA